MRVIFLCLDHFPYSGACTNLILKLFAAGMKEHFSDIHVITIKKKLSEPDYEIIDNINIHRIIRWRDITQAELKNNFFNNVCLTVKGVIIKGVLRSMQYVHPEKLFLRKIEIYALQRVLRKLRCTDNDILIPIAGYYETIKVALDFKEKVGVKVVVYQVDPCSTNYTYSDDTQKKRSVFEKMFYEQSDAVITTPILLHELRENLTESVLKKVTAMEFPNVAPEHSENNEAIRLKADKNKQRCVFAGMVYLSARNPAHTMRLFSAIEDETIQLHFVGLDRKNAQEYMDQRICAEKFVFHGKVPLFEAKTHIETADILVNIGNILINQVPSKIFEYISSGKPIVNVCAHRNCPSLRYLEKYPYVLNLFEDEIDFNGQVQILEKFIKEYSGKRVPAQYIREAFKECTAEYCARQIIQIIQYVRADE